jgi:hypothetical protein
VSAKCMTRTLRVDRGTAGFLREMNDDHQEYCAVRLTPIALPTGLTKQPLHRTPRLCNASCVSRYGSLSVSVSVSLSLSLSLSLFAETATRSLVSCLVSCAVARHGYISSYVGLLVQSTRLIARVTNCTFLAMT